MEKKKCSGLTRTIVLATIQAWILQVLMEEILCRHLSLLMAMRNTLPRFEYSNLSTFFIVFELCVLIVIKEWICTYCLSNVLKQKKEIQKSMLSTQDPNSHIEAIFT